MKVCKHCGEINTNDSTFCCSCGKDGFVYQENTTCPHCGKDNDKSFEHCIHCGKPLREQATESDGKTYAAVPVDVREEMTSVYGGANTELARCPHCNSVVPVTAIFCTKCGTSVASLHEHRVVQRRICPHCGRQNSLEAVYCSYCFCTLADAVTEDMQVTHESQNHGEMILRQTYLEGLNGKKLVCPNCGTVNGDSETFCVNCGLKLEIEPVKKYCPNCGTENPSDSGFCTKCRWSFDGATPEDKIKWTCPHCDHLNSEEDAFCSYCGQKRKQ